MSEAGDPTVRGGPIAFMASNPIAANLLMVFLLFAGLLAAGELVQEMLPDASLDRVQVMVPYPGAAPQEVDEAIVRKIEEELGSLDGVKRIEASASEGLGTVTAEFKSGTDIDRALNEAKARVDRIPSFPAGAERPEVREVTSRQSVIRLLVHGDVPERTLKELAYDIEDGIAALPEVSYVDTSGFREYEISIEVPSHRLRALGLTLSDIAVAVRRGSMDLSAGSLSTGGEEIRVRTIGQNYEQYDFEDIIVLSRPDGTSLRLGDIADLRDGFADTDLITRFNGNRAIRVDVTRTADEQVFEISEAVKAYLATEVIPALPAGVGVEIWRDDSTLVAGSLSVLIENGVLGLLLVFLALTFFLEIRLALWVAAGLAVALVGTLWGMQMLGVSINMFSMMALVLALGIVVDDAIVVGENIFAGRRRDRDGLTTAIRGAQRMSAPVIFSVLTTVTAFCALLTVPGSTGKIMRSVPLVVIIILMISLVESLLILPRHLSHLPPPGRTASTWAGRRLLRIQRAVDRGLQWLIDGPLDRGLRLATNHPPIVLATAAGAVLLVTVLIGSGLVRVEFLPQVEGDVIAANFELPTGSPADRTAAVGELVEQTGRRVAERLASENPGGAAADDWNSAITVGEPAELFNPLRGDRASVPRSHVGAVQFALPEGAAVPASEFERLWREETGTVQGLRHLVFSSGALELPPPVYLELSHPDPVELEAIAQEFVEELQQVDGVFDIRTNQDDGFREIQLELKPPARTLGLTLEDLAQQTRSAFFGSEALRVLRGREDMRVYLRLPEQERSSIADLERFVVRTPGGAEVPLKHVASAEFVRSSTAIHKVDGRRVVTVTANVDPDVVTGQLITPALERDILAPLAAEHPGFGYGVGGEQRQQREIIGALSGAMLFVFIIIFALIAIPFGSWSQPLIIMAAIPLGLVGAVVGHLLLGLSFGFMSVQGLVGCTGVVVNDALVMVTFINEKRSAGLAAQEAIIAGAKARVRSILLTSVTTFVGVAPLVFETDPATVHLVPLAAALGFGILIATPLLMLVVPALAMLHVNLHARLRIATGAGAAESQPEVA
ncbi:MAG: efflux RND transporter permease subunit [Holophagales bacterium]|nr:efflux RND transporter permease subunit [Holophagales bacterium]MYG29898.1 efflux RND transporter permease subunit [Holophagales bacterium]MYI79312.1 efflux RND transporter permease subunit [Holophagales bacterium]